MLLRIDEELVIKSDRYCFMVCQDKGKQKFPGGVVADYFKPLTYHGCISSITVNNDKLKDVVKAEIALFEQIHSLKINREEVNFMGFTAVKDRDCIMVKIAAGYNLYYGTINQALTSCWSHHLRISDDFGHSSNDQSVFGTYDGILSCLKNAQEQLHALVAQPEELQPSKLSVVGSNPTQGAN